MTLRAVLFDLDGTLIDSAHLWLNAFSSLATSRGAVIAEDTLAGLTGLSTVDAVATIARRLRWRAADPEADARWVERRVCEEYRAGVAWRAGALELVAAAAEADFLTGLVTSSARQVVDALQVAGGWPAFDVVVTGDDVTAFKPAPDPYLTAATELGLRPQDCIAVEDSPHGVTSALAANCAVIAVGSDAPCPPFSRCIRVEFLKGVQEHLVPTGEPWRSRS